MWVRAGPILGLAWPPGRPRRRGGAPKGPVSFRGKLRRRLWRPPPRPPEWAGLALPPRKKSGGKSGPQARTSPEAPPDAVPSAPLPPRRPHSPPLATRPTRQNEEAQQRLSSVAYPLFRPFVGGGAGVVRPILSLDVPGVPSEAFPPPPTPPSPGNRDQSGLHSVSSTAWLKLKELVGQQDCDVIRCRNKTKQRSDRPLPGLLSSSCTRHPQQQVPPPPETTLRAWQRNTPNSMAPG